MPASKEIFQDEVFRDAHILEVDEVARKLDTNVDTGLRAVEAKKRLEKYGENKLDEPESTPLWKLVLEQFDDLLVKILLGAAIISFLLASFEEHADHHVSAFVEPLVIVVILVLNAVIGVWQEHNAENALEALKALQPKLTTVIRDGAVIHDFNVEDLVPGDIVEVGVGNRVPADIRLTKLLTTTLRIDQSTLTGESNTVLKQVHVCDSKNPEHRQKTFKINYIFSGTVVTNGKAQGVVVTTGMATEIGEITTSVTSTEEEKTPLKQKLDDFGEQLSKVIGIICVLVWVMNYNCFFDPVHGSLFKGCIYYFKIAVALGVAAIPEGLPAVITLCLALGTRKMAEKKAIVRKLPSVETLGCCTVICSDKTGTLTLNEMTVTELVIADEKSELRQFSVDGTSYDPRGSVKDLNYSVNDKGIRGICEVASFCNDAQVTMVNDKPVRAGEPTEAALRVLVEKIGAPYGVNVPKGGFGVNDYFARLSTRRAVLEFSRGRKSMSVLCASTSGPKTNVLYCKGAPESILLRCNRLRLRNGTDVKMTDQLRAALEERVNKLARTPLRTLGFAIKEDLIPLMQSYDGSENHPGYQNMTCDPDLFAETIEKDMVFLGMVGIKDPPRAEVRPSIELCAKAGIRVIMITGDKKETADAIAREIGIFGADEDISTKSFTGAAFFALDRNKQVEYLTNDKGGRVFSRTDPKDKQQLVKMLKELGEVAAMTGDGVNDAPALKEASIGIAMGSGTEVAKEASDMVLADDNFASIVAAVEEGRSIYSNMKAFIRYLISSNIGEVASIFLTAALGVPEGLIPVQLLWVNLVTDGPPATALGFNPPDKDVMRKPPRSKEDQLINSWVFFRYLVIGTYVGVATVGIFVYWYVFYDWAQDGHTLVTYNQLSNWGKCKDWEGFATPKPVDGVSFDNNACAYFTAGKNHASTLSLSVLVVIEMFNSLNALSEDQSLLVMPPWCNLYVCFAIFCSMSVHFFIMYVPFFANIFQLVPLNKDDWYLVVVFSFPVILIDEVLKTIGRIYLERQLAVRLAEAKKRS